MSAGTPGHARARRDRAAHRRVTNGTLGVPDDAAEKGTRVGTKWGRERRARKTDALASPPWRTSGLCEKKSERVLVGEEQVLHHELDPFRRLTDEWFIRCKADVP